MSRVDENAELGRVIAEGAESGLMSDKLAELLFIQDIGKSLAVIADSMRPTGHWKELEKITSSNELICECSVCGHVVSFLNDYPKSNYCPKCGARMTESEE